MRLGGKTAPISAARSAEGSDMHELASAASANSMVEIARRVATVGASWLQCLSVPHSAM
jgi:hypothetical protein